MRLRDNYGNTCVHYAALLGRTKMLELLLALSDAEEQGEDSERGLAILERAQHFKKAAHLTNVAVAQIGGRAWALKPNRVGGERRGRVDACLEERKGVLKPLT